MRNPRRERRTRRRIDPGSGPGQALAAEFAAPLHVKPSHAGQKPAPLLDGYRMATEAENEAARAQLREGHRQMREAIERRGGFPLHSMIARKNPRLCERCGATDNHACVRSDCGLVKVPPAEPKSPEGR